MCRKGKDKRVTRQGLSLQESLRHSVLRAKRGETIWHRNLSPYEIAKGNNVPMQFQALLWRSCFPLLREMQPIRNRLLVEPALPQ
jgi:hypothetical protein